MKKNKLIILVLFIAITLLYVFFPFLVTVEKANEYNIRRFHKKQIIFEETIINSVNIFKERKKYSENIIISFEDLDDKQQHKLQKIGINGINISIECKNNTPFVKAKFYTTKKWMNRVLNNVSIEYDFERINEYPNLPNKEARIYSIRVGDGWFLEIDTDYI